MRNPDKAAEPVLAEGTRVGDFQIRGLLGEGAMGQVYLAQDTRLGRRVALKLIKRAVIQLHGAERFLEEARATASFNHPHIVTLYAVGEHDGRPYLALEYIDGDSLRARLSAGPLPLRDALRCCRDVAEAIAEAHHRGLVHADLKPENIVIPTDGRVRVVDFGLARLAQDAPSAASGTPAYMAPERWRGAPPTGAIDVWALGIVLHELITGSRPIPDATLLHLAFATNTLDLPGLSIAPWSHLVRDCLSLDPAARPTAQEMVRRLSSLLTSQATTDKDARTAGVLATHAQYLTTELAADETYVHHRRLAFSAHNLGPPGDTWLVPVVERMVRQVLRDREDRQFEVDHVDGAAWIELAFARHEDGFRIDARFRSDERVLGSATASSVAGATRELADALEAKLGLELQPLESKPEELEAMRRVGASSVQLFRRYQSLLHAYLSTMLPAAHRLAAAARELVAADAEWAHPYVLLMLLEGLWTEAGRHVRIAARAAADTARDPCGTELLMALELFASGDNEGACDIAGTAFRRNSADLSSGYLLTISALTVHRIEEAAAVARQLHALYPDLVFGMLLVEILRGEARHVDADRVIREWVTAAPENVVARVELTRVEANDGRLEEARARAREAAIIHRERVDALPDLFEALMEAEQVSDARVIAEQMLVGSPLSRARGRYRVAVASLFQGRFAAAYDAVRRAISEHHAFGIQSELTQCLELARSRAPLVADLEAQRRHTEELAGVFANLLAETGTAVATRFELALLDHTTPSIDEHLASLEDGPVRDVARRRMLRAAAVADLGSAHKAVAGGFSTYEENTASLVTLGLCAQRVGELDLARRSFEQASRRWSSISSNQASPYHAILARFHLASVLADLGEPALARASCEAFLRCWSNPDRPIPEVALARQLLTSLPL